MTVLSVDKYGEKEYNNGAMSSAAFLRRPCTRPARVVTKIEKEIL